jgi:hypothetical protein
MISDLIKEVMKWNSLVKEVAEKQYNGDDSMGTVDGWTGDIETHLEVILKKVRCLEKRIIDLKFILNQKDINE